MKSKIMALHRFVGLMLMPFVAISGTQDVIIAKTTLGQSGIYRLNSEKPNKGVLVRVELHPAPIESKALSIGNWNAVKKIAISVNQKELYVPLGCSFLLDVDGIALTYTTEEWKLIVKGGDGSESYTYEIQFDPSQVKDCHFQKNDGLKYFTKDEMTRYKRMHKTKN
jgi:hypothetical protein